MSHTFVAANSLYGGTQSRRALAGHVGGQHRLQEVRTPVWVLDAAAQALGGIYVDPCAASEPSHWFADHNLTIDPAALPLELELAMLKGKDGSKPRIKDLRKQLKPLYLGGSLVKPWPTGGAFVNPAFEFLEEWMERCQAQYLEQRTPVVGLWPVRTHRDWWIKYSRHAEVVLLRYDVRFVGHDSAFPAPLCLASYGCVIPDLGERETGRWRP